MAEIYNLLKISTLFECTQSLCSFTERSENEHTLT